MSAAEMLQLWVSALSEGQEVFLLFIVLGIGTMIVRELAQLIRFGVR